MTTETRPAGYHRAALVNELDGGMCDDCDSACPRCDKARTLVDRHAAEVRAAAFQEAAELRDELKERKATLGALVEHWRGLALDRAATIARLRTEAAEVRAAALTEYAEVAENLAENFRLRGDGDMEAGAREVVALLRENAEAAARPDNTRGA